MAKLGGSLAYRHENTVLSYNVLLTWVFGPSPDVPSYPIAPAHARGSFSKSLNRHSNPVPEYQRFYEVSIQEGQS